MNHDDIDRALRDEPEIVPSAGFAYRVMGAVRRQAEHQRAIPFPWKPLASGLAISVVVAVVGVVTGEAPPEVVASEGFVYVAPALAWLSTALAGSLGLAWWSVRLGGR